MLYNNFKRLRKRLRLNSTDLPVSFKPGYWYFCIAILSREIRSIYLMQNRFKRFVIRD